MNTNDIVQICVSNLANTILHSSVYKSSEDLKESFMRSIHTDLKVIIRAVVLEMFEDKDTKMMIKKF